MPKTKKLEAAIDSAIEERIADGFRTHLGASIIGKECARDIWYSFRWAKAANHSARIQRIFDRGQREEEYFIKLLRDAGVKVWSHNKDGEQFSFRAVCGHLQGHLDGISLGIPDLPDEFAVDEFKTHKDSSFKQLIKHGVEKAFFEHYVQGTLYAIKKKKTKYVLYCAVNKDTDELYFELFKAKKSIAKKYEARAKYIIFSDEPPPRIASTKTHFKCKMCRHYDLCWNQEIPAVNCRTCGWSEPKEDGRWHCSDPEANIEDLDVKKGCPQHMFNMSILQNFKPEFVATEAYNLLDAETGQPLNLAKGYLVLKVDDKKIKHSPEHTTSAQLFKRFNK